MAVVTNSSGDNLTDEQRLFLSYCEEKFADRYTSKDEEYLAIYNKETSDPPIVPHWLSAHRGRGNNRNRPRGRSDYRDRSDRSENYRDRSDNNRDRDRDYNRHDSRREHRRNEASPYYRERRNW